MRAKQIKLLNSDREVEAIAVRFVCPGCGNHHVPRVEKLLDTYDGPLWEWNGSLENPTFSPSLRVMGGPGGATSCHSFIRDGKIEYLSDCTHALAGQTVELPELDETGFQPLDPDFYKKE